VNRSLATKVKKLQEALDDRKLAFNALSAKNALLEADITVATQQYNDAENEIKKIQIEKEQLLNQIRREHKQEKDVKCRNIYPIHFSCSFNRNSFIFMINFNEN
jgi:chromosome segregation ATPase